MELRCGRDLRTTQATNMDSELETQCQWNQGATVNCAVSFWYVWGDAGMVDGRDWGPGSFEVCLAIQA